MEKKSKYTLFPTPPSPPPSQPLPPDSETSELPPQHQHPRQHKQEPSWPPPPGSFQPSHQQDPSSPPPRRKSSVPLALDPYLPPPRDPRRPQPRPSTARNDALAVLFLLFRILLPQAPPVILSPHASPTTATKSPQDSILPHWPRRGRQLP